MMRLLLLLLIAFYVSIAYSQAQLPPLSRAYQLNNYSINPAISGIESYADGMLGFRQQWVGLEGAPRTIRLSLHAPIGSQNFYAPPNMPSSIVDNATKQPPQYQNRYQDRSAHHGIGGQVILDQIGPFDRQEVSLSYAYHLPLSHKLQLSAGLQAGWNQYRLASQRITLGTPMDAAILSGEERYGYPTMGIGLWAYTDNAYLGVSLYQNLRSATRANVDTSAPSNWTYVASGYKLKLNPYWDLLPNMLVRITSQSLSYDLGMRALWQERIWVGAAYRSSQEGVGLLGMNITPMLSLAYAYETGGSALHAHNSGSHEIILNVRLFNGQKVLCPQYMW